MGSSLLFPDVWVLLRKKIEQNQLLLRTIVQQNVIFLLSFVFTFASKFDHLCAVLCLQLWMCVLSMCAYVFSQLIFFSAVFKHSS